MPILNAKGYILAVILFLVDHRVSRMGEAGSANYGHRGIEQPDLAAYQRTAPSRGGKKWWAKQRPRGPRNRNKNVNVNLNVKPQSNQFERLPHRSPRVEQTTRPTTRFTRSGDDLEVRKGHEEAKMLPDKLPAQMVDCPDTHKENDRYSSSFGGNSSSLTNARTMSDDDFQVAGELGTKKTSSVHVGEDITLCWIETTTIKEDHSMNPVQRLVIREYTISFENSATIPQRYLECIQLEGEINSKNNTFPKSALFEIMDEDTRHSRIVNFTTVSHSENLTVWQHKRVRCGVGPVVTKTIIEWTDDVSDNPKKRVEIKVSPKVHRLTAEPSSVEPCTTEFVDPQITSTTSLTTTQPESTDCVGDKSCAQPTEPEEVDSNQGMVEEGTTRSYTSSSSESEFELRTTPAPDGGPEHTEPLDVTKAPGSITDDIAGEGTTQTYKPMLTEAGFELTTRPGLEESQEHSVPAVVTKEDDSVTDKNTESTSIDDSIVPVTSGAETSTTTESSVILSVTLGNEAIETGSHEKSTPAASDAFSVQQSSDYLTTRRDGKTIISMMPTTPVTRIDVTEATTGDEMDDLSTSDLDNTSKVTGVTDSVELVEGTETTTESVYHDGQMTETTQSRGLVTQFPEPSSTPTTISGIEELMPESPSSSNVITDVSESGITTETSDVIESNTSDNGMTTKMDEADHTPFGEWKGSTSGNVGEPEHTKPGDLMTEPSAADVTTEPTNDSERESESAESDRTTGMQGGTDETITSTPCDPNVRDCEESPGLTTDENRAGEGEYEKTTALPIVDNTAKPTTRLAGVTSMKITTLEPEILSHVTEYSTTEASTAGTNDKDDDRSRTSGEESTDHEFVTVSCGSSEDCESTIKTPVFDQKLDQTDITSMVTEAVPTTRSDELMDSSAGEATSGSDTSEAEAGSDATTSENSSSDIETDNNHVTSDTTESEINLTVGETTSESGQSEAGVGTDEATLETSTSDIEAGGGQVTSDTTESEMDSSVGGTTPESDKSGAEMDSEEVTLETSTSDMETGSGQVTSNTTESGMDSSVGGTTPESDKSGAEMDSEEVTLETSTSDMETGSGQVTSDTTESEMDSSVGETTPGSEKSEAGVGSDESALETSTSDMESDSGQDSLDTTKPEIDSSAGETSESDKSEAEVGSEEVTLATSTSDMETDSGQVTSDTTESEMDSSVGGTTSESDESEGDVGSEEVTLETSTSDMESDSGQVSLDTTEPEIDSSVGETSESDKSEAEVGSEEVTVETSTSDMESDSGQVSSDTTESEMDSSVGGTTSESDESEAEVGSEEVTLETSTSDMETGSGQVTSDTTESGMDSSLGGTTPESDKSEAEVGSEEVTSETSTSDMETGSGQVTSDTTESGGDSSVGGTTPESDKSEAGVGSEEVTLETSTSEIETGSGQVTSDTNEATIESGSSETSTSKIESGQASFGTTESEIEFGSVGTTSKTGSSDIESGSDEVTPETTKSENESSSSEISSETNLSDDTSITGASTIQSEQNETYEFDVNIETTTVTDVHDGRRTTIGDYNPNTTDATTEANDEYGIGSSTDVIAPTNDSQEHVLPHTAIEVSTEFTHELDFSEQTTFESPTDVSTDCEITGECDTTEMERYSTSGDSTEVVCDDGSTEICTVKSQKPSYTNLPPTTGRTPPELDLDSTTVHKGIGATIEAPSTASPPKHKLALRIQILLEHIDENKNKQKLVEVEKHLLFNEQTEEHGNPSLMGQITSLNNSVDMQTVHTLFNCSSLERLTGDIGAFAAKYIAMHQDQQNVEGPDDTVIDPENSHVRKRRDLSHQEQQALDPDVEMSLPGIHTDIHSGLSHVMSLVSSGHDIERWSAGLVEVPRSRILELVADPQDTRIHERRKRRTIEDLTIEKQDLPKDVKEVGQWSNERVKRALSSGHVRTLTEFTIYEGP